MKLLSQVILLFLSIPLNGQQTERKSDYFFQRAAAFQELGQYENAIIDYTTAIELENNPNALAFYFNSRGDCFKELNFFDKALKDYTNSINFSPSNYLALYSRAEVKFELELYNAALEDIDIVLDNNENFINAYKIKGNCLKELNYFEYSLHSFSKGIDIVEGIIAMQAESGVVIEDETLFPLNE